VPIVRVTAEPKTYELLQQARTLGVAATVRKPWKPQGLGDLVQSVLETWHP